MIVYGLVLVCRCLLTSSVVLAVIVVLIDMPIGPVPIAAACAMLAVLYCTWRRLSALLIQTQTEEAP